MLKIIQKRIKRKLDDEINVVKAGFRQGRCTFGHIFNLRMIIQKCHVFNQPVFTCFVSNSGCRWWCSQWCPRAWCDSQGQSWHWRSREYPPSANLQVHVPRTVRREWIPVKTAFAPPANNTNGLRWCCHGTIVVPCSYGKRQCDTEFYIVETPGPVILGLPTSRDLNFVTLNRDIEVVVRKCATCQEVQRAQPREPLMPHETPSRAWQIVGTDLFVINRETYLLVSDYFNSKFPFVYMIPSPVTSTAIIGKMKSLFAEQGIPQRVISDNGGHFSSEAVRRFADQWCFDHVTSSPHYPNRMATSNEKFKPWYARWRKVCFDLTFRWLYLCWGKHP